MHRRIPPCDDSARRNEQGEARREDTSGAGDATHDADVELSSVLDAVAARLDEVLEAPAAHDVPSAPSRPDGVREPSDHRPVDEGDDEVRGNAPERDMHALRERLTRRQVDADGEVDRRPDAPRPAGAHVPWILISLTAIAAGALLVLVWLL